MKRNKEFALIVAGIDEEYQNGVIEGIIEYAIENDINISCFSAFGGVVSGRGFDTGEYNIYTLINYKKFDGVLLMLNTIASRTTKQRLVQEAEKSGLPVVVFDCSLYPQFYNVTINNVKSMEELTRHVIEKHGAKKLSFISGPRNNPEAMERLDAFDRVRREAGITDEYCYVYYGQFRSIDGKYAVEDILKHNSSIPDAIISANDAMALSAVKELKQRGYNVPDDLIVTGFDNILNARYHLPALTTIERPLGMAGKKACEILMQCTDGEKTEHTHCLEAKVLLSESCGCAETNKDDLNTFREITYQTIDNSRFDVHILNSLISEMSETETLEDCMKVVGEMINELNCEKLCICLCDDWINSFESYRNSTPLQGYTRKMIVPMIWDKGEFHEGESFNSSEMTPVPFTDGGNISYYLPLHFRERCLGYIVISNSDFPTRSFVFHTLIMSISNSLENISKLNNLNHAIEELDRMYIMDHLCGIYNRNGLMRTAKEMLSRCNSNVLISFIDMDGLKIINDEYGHNEGDIALQTMAAILKECCMEDMICARFGGDEFIIVGVNAKQDDIEELESRFRKSVENMNNIIRKPYRVDGSIGSLISTVDNNTNLFGLISQADEIMYEQKKRKKTSRYLRKS